MTYDGNIRKARILIVDDQKDFCRVMAMGLNAAGYEVVCAHSCTEAVAKAENQDLVLMDIDLGHDDGVQTAQLLKESYGTPIVFLTGNTDNAVLRRAKQVEPYGYIIKPTNHVQMQTTIEMVLHKAEVDRHLNTHKKQLEEGHAALEAALDQMQKTQALTVQHGTLKAVNHLAAGVAHEVNNPVGFVSSNVETMNSYMSKIRHLLSLYEDLRKNVGQIDENNLISQTENIVQAWKEMKIDFVLEDMDTIVEDSRAGLERVTTIVDHLRDFSGVDDAVELTPYNLNDGIQSALSMLQNELGATDVVMELGDLQLIPCFPKQINQALYQILKNAIQALREQNDGQIKIKTELQEGGIVCSLTDNGCGMDESVRDNIFNPFFTTREPGEGMGLGLAIAYDCIVVKHHGVLNVASTLGQGTTFTLQIPRTNTELETVDVEIG